MGNIRNPKFDEAYKLYLDGLSLEQVAKELSVTRQCVYKAFKKRGLILRGKSFKPYQYFDGLKFTLRPSGYYALSNNSRMQMHRYVWEFYNGKIPNGFDIHHIDECRANNDIINLECLSKSEHTRKYSPHNNKYTKGRKRDPLRAV
jgi:hypothetical protein